MNANDERSSHVDGGEPSKKRNAKEKYPLLFKRLRVVAHNYETTAEHMLAVCLAVAFPTIEKLTVEEFRGQFGVGGLMRRYEATQNRRRLERLEKHIAFAKKRETRIVEKVRARGVTNTTK
jgi:hypothetical protein